MKKILTLASGIMMLLMAFGGRQAFSQVYAEYMPAQKNGQTQFVDITSDARSSSILRESFWLPPNSNTFNPDDGYYKVSLPFDFGFNGDVYREIWICINGFVQLLPPGDFPLTIPADYQLALFEDASSYPNNVVAPYWGDHWFRSTADNAGLPDTADKFTITDISYMVDESVPDKARFIVQWKDLNINYEDPITQLPVTSSVATFQVILHEDAEGVTSQGNIEFAYGPAGADLSVSKEQKLITAGATVGVKGKASDYINGLIFYDSENPDQTLQQMLDLARSSTKLTGQWQPSNGTDTTILFDAIQRLYDPDTWGDGDADLSKAPGGRHQMFRNNQPRFVTVNDAWTIMRSIATAHKLDSIRFRNAYHADVNHNGRYFYDPDVLVPNPKTGELHPLKKDLFWRDDFYWENLDNPDYSVSDLNQLYFEANEHDASMILMYISARLPYLPWVLDTIPLYGRVNNVEQLADNIRFGSAEKTGSAYQMPIYLNGYTDKPMSMKIEFDGEITNLNTFENDGQVLKSTFAGNRLVIIGNGEFDGRAPIAYVTVQSDDAEINAYGIRFNDVDKAPVAINAGGVAVDESTNAGISIRNTPNPFTNNTVITVNIPAEGNYTLTVFDAIGNKVKTIASDNLEPGLHTFNWGGTAQDGSKVDSGVYIYRLTGENVSVSEKMILTK